MNRKMVRYNSRRGMRSWFRDQWEEAGKLGKPGSKLSRKMSFALVLEKNRKARQNRLKGEAKRVNKEQGTNPYIK